MDHPNDPPLPGVDARLFPPGRNWLSRRLAASDELNRELKRQAANRKDLIIHAHGLWLAPNIYAGLSAKQHGVPLIVSPRGMVAPAALEFSRYRKVLVWRFLQQPAYAPAATWHATSEAESEDIRRIGVVAPIAVLPNGVDLPDLDDPPADRERTVLYLGRIHPKKALPHLLEAWSKIGLTRPGWRLRIVGPDEGGHAEELRALATRLNLSEVSVEAPVYGDEKARLLASASLFVLPTLSENFGIAVAEALAAGTPVIVSKGAPWGEIESVGCGWWHEIGPEPLAAALTEAMSLSSGELSQMGDRGREWTRATFGWDPIAQNMARLYTWVLGKGPQPDFVRID